MTFAVCALMLAPIAAGVLYGFCAPLRAGHQWLREYPKTSNSPETTVRSDE